MPQSPLATAADYADAMFTARKARNWLVALLLLVLLAQLIIFLAARYTDLLAAAAVDPASAVQPTTAPADAIPAMPADTHTRTMIRQVLEYVVSLTGFAGVVLAVVLSLVLLLILNIMLVGRLIGVSHVTGAYIWSLVLLLLLFPWQAMLNSQTLSGADFRIPGVLYGWSELVADAHFPPDPLPLAILKWSRFVAFPLLAMVLVLVIRSKSQRGLRLALGEVELEADLAAGESAQ